MARKLYTSTDPVKLGRTVVIWAYIQIATEVLLALAYAYGMSPAGMRTVDPGGLTAGDVAAIVPSLMYLAAYVVGGFLALKWVYRVNRNAHSFAEGLTISPPWSVGWFFVPVACLWKPYEAISDAWQASERPQRWRTAPRPKFLRWWWAAWLVSGFLSYIAGVMTRFGDAQTTGVTHILATAASVPAALLFIRLVRRLSEIQHYQIEFGLFSESPPVAEASRAAVLGAAPA